MNQIGPSIESLTRRLLDLPPEFLEEPRIASSGTVHVAALVHDVLAGRGARVTGEILAPYAASLTGADRNRLQVVSLLCWLMSDEWFVQAPISPAQVQRVLDATASELASSCTAARFRDDPDRREEMARVVLARLDHRPQGESLAQATDRLSGLSAVERKRLLDASRAAEKRAREIREALAKKAAEDSADKWSRE